MARANWFELPEDFDPDASREIGATERFPTVQVTRVGPARDGSGELVYLDDVPAKFGLQSRSATYLCGTQERSRSETARWWRLECKVAKSGGIDPNNELVLSLTPHASGWFCRRPFKVANHKSQSERFMPLATEQTAAIQQLEALSYDYWESGDFLTAGVSKPAEPALRTIRGGASGFWLLGLCANVNDYVSQLREHPKVQSWLRMTENGTIIFWKPDAPLEGRPRLFDETIQERDSLMNLAIMQALAGPDDATPECYLDKPVVDWVHRRYVDHLNNLNRKISRAQPPEGDPNRATVRKR